MYCYKSPDWRKPNSASEADSLVLDILTYLEFTTYLSSERVKALTAALNLVVYGYPKHINYQQAKAILNIIMLYSDELTGPLCTALRCFSPKPDFVSLADGFIKEHRALKKIGNKPQSEVVQAIKEQYAKIVADTIEEHNGAGRSVIVWKDRTLCYLHSGGYISPVEKSSMQTIELTPEQLKGLSIGKASLLHPNLKQPKLTKFQSNMIWVGMIMLWFVFSIIILTAIKP